MATNPYAAIAIRSDNPYASIAVNNQQGGGDPSSAGKDVDPGNAFTSGTPLATFRANVEQASQPLEPWERRQMSAPERVGHAVKQGLAETIGQAVAHPIDTVGGIVQGFTHMSPNDPENPLAKMGASAVQDFEQNGPMEATSHLGGQALGGWATGEAGGAAGAGAARAIIPRMGKLGEGMQDLAAANLNRKYPPTMREMERGNNPGRGMLDAGIGPTISRGSLANKVAGATEAVGSRIGDVVNRADNNVFAPTITSQELRPAIRNPIQEQLGVVNGPGGTSPETPYQTLHDSMQLRAPGAKNPIYGPNAPETVAPSDLWKTIQNVDKNTRFNVDPEVENVNETRRDIRSNLRPVLESTDPTLKPLSRTYGDLRSADTAIARSQSPFHLPRGLSGIIDSTIDSVPVNTTVSSALNRIGGGMKNMATNAPEWLGGKGGSPSALPFAYRMSQKPLELPDDVPGNADYCPRSMAAGGFPRRDPFSPDAPNTPMALPAEAGGGEIEPMVGIRRGQYPPLAEPFARTRIRPNIFTGPAEVRTSPFEAAPSGNVYGDSPRGPRELPAPKEVVKAKKGKV